MKEKVLKGIRRILGTIVLGYSLFCAQPVFADTEHFAAEVINDGRPAIGATLKIYPESDSHHFYSPVVFTDGTGRGNIFMPGLEFDQDGEVYIFQADYCEGGTRYMGTATLEEGVTLIDVKPVSADLMLKNADYKVIKEIVYDDGTIVRLKAPEKEPDCLSELVEKSQGSDRDYSYEYYQDWPNGLWTDFVMQYDQDSNLMKICIDSERSVYLGNCRWDNSDVMSGEYELPLPDGFNGVFQVEVEGKNMTTGEGVIFGNYSILTDKGVMINLPN